MRSWLFLCAVVLSACASGGINETIRPQVVYVDDTLRLPFTITTDPLQSEVSYTIAPLGSSRQPTLMERVAGFDRTEDGFVFWWAPMVTHAGSYDVTISLAVGGQRTDQKTFRVDVKPSVRTAPVFVNEPGNIYRNDPACWVDVTFQVRDDDTSLVNITAEGVLPQGATLTQQTPKTARFRWQPPPSNAQRFWPVNLLALDREHEPVRFRYVIVLDAQGPCQSL